MDTLIPPMTRPWIIGHRGVTDSAPENTLAAFDAALAQGVDGIEFDVQLSRDHVPVVYHHRTLYHVGLRGQRPFGLDLADLRLLAVRGASGQGGPIPTLEEVLTRYGRRTHLFLEVKARPRLDCERHLELAQRVAEAVVRHGVVERLCLLSFNRAVLDACAQALPGLRTCLNLEEPVDPAAPGATAGLFALCLAVRHLTPAFVNAVHRGGLACFTFTCDTPRTARRALAARPDAIITGRPAWLATTLAPHGDDR